MEKPGMTNRAAIVTGATRGIGKGIFKRLISGGVSVATVYHQDEAAAEQFRREAQASGVTCLIERVDVRDFSGLSEFVSSVVEEFGRVDYLVNNAGIDVFGPLSDLTFDDWKKSQDVILNAPFVLCKQVLPFMRRQGFGRIVNIGASSKDYMKGTPGLSAFGVHKGALTIFTKTLALEEVGNGITVNMVAPGSTRDAGTLPEDRRVPTNRIPIGRRVEIAEVVEAVMYFLSDNSGSVTGQFLGVNGGLST
jgi:NAD(P)-dependent dehydrogenase (short-subunit alcohol dehydrogenase family)